MCRQKEGAPCDAPFFVSQSDLYRFSPDWRDDSLPSRADTRYGLPPSALEMSAIAFCPRTLLPAASSGGDTTAMPNLPGETAINPPPTPLFAGSPVANSHLPESSYSPAVAMTASVGATCCCPSTCWAVIGFRPPLASVAAMTARSRAFTLTEHWRVYRSVACNG